LWNDRFTLETVLAFPSPASSTLGHWRTPAIILACGCAVLLISMGLRATPGIFLKPMTQANGWTREVFSFAIALQNLMWGLASPFFGAVADRYGAGRTVVTGAVLYVLGLSWMAFSQTAADLTLSAGIVVALGISGTATGVVMSVMARAVGPQQRSLALGLGGAFASMGQFVMLPLAQAWIDAWDWHVSLLLHAAMAALIVPLAAGLAGKAVDAGNGPPQSMSAALAQAGGDRSFHLLFWGYFVCGFQVVFIAVHFPSFLMDKGFPAHLGMHAIALVGLFNIMGSFCAGWLGGRYTKKYLLSGIYLSRSIVITAFLLLPITTTSVYVFSALIGFLWLSTVPLTNGLVAYRYGLRYMAMLSGLVFFGHQIGAFLGVWLGGLIYDGTGAYDMAWTIAIALGVFASLVHLPIREAPLAGDGAARPAVA
jgi:MFS family permease